MPIFQSVVVARRRKERGQRRERDRKNMHTDKSHIMSIEPPVNRQQQHTYIHTQTKRREEVMWCHKKKSTSTTTTTTIEAKTERNKSTWWEEEKESESSTVWVCFLVLFLLFHFMVPIPSILFLFPSYLLQADRPTDRPFVFSRPSVLATSQRFPPTRYKKRKILATTHSSCLIDPCSFS